MLISLLIVWSVYVLSQKKEKNIEFLRIQCDFVCICILLYFCSTNSTKYIQFNVMSDGEQQKIFFKLIIIQTVVIIFQLSNYLLNPHTTDISCISC